MGHTKRWVRRAGLFALLAGGSALLAGCSQDTQAGRWGLLEYASDRAPAIGNLWVGAWIASMVVGVFVWGLIFYSMARFRRRNEAHVPRQSRYNLPMEILYTLVPFLIVGVLFFYTVHTQNRVNAKVAEPDHTINVIGQKWQWTFNYMEAGNAAVGADVHEVGTLEKVPDLYLPVNKSVRFNLVSADVIHSFWVPAFAYKLDVIPGHPNSFDLTPTKVGVYDGKCAELCGTYHAAMIFKVHVVTEAEYTRYLKGLADKGQTGEIKAPPGATALPSPASTEETHE